MKSAEDRRARWDRTCANAKARGAPVESDPRFVEWIEEWICGAIDMTTVRQRYAALVRSGSKSSVGNAPAAAKNTLEEVFAELPEIAGLRHRDPKDRHDTSDAIEAAWSKAEVGT